MKNLKRFGFLPGAPAQLSSCESDDIQEEIPVPVIRFTEVLGSGDIAVKPAEFRALRH
ncbi:hypothetical protein LZD49_20535 [Dyadobacter sp. CY261]|uniref:hypothetical protein n=1 Tax=Dyadobacter sp. CY261 TaxID=2907203 RepID=UPI001F31CD1B|nr:hypothetical protein [Dyadobacter sp. CY261]MCF0072878.1 hypothetical protein [Dyadobacter sp. CY261]